MDRQKIWPYRYALLIQPGGDRVAVHVADHPALTREGKGGNHGRYREVFHRLDGRRAPDQPQGRQRCKYQQAKGTAAHGGRAVARQPALGPGAVKPTRLWLPSQ